MGGSFFSSIRNCIFKVKENQSVNLLANIGISMIHRKKTQIQQKNTNKILLIKQSKSVSQSTS